MKRFASSRVLSQLLFSNTTANQLQQSARASRVTANTVIRKFSGHDHSHHHNHNSGCCQGDKKKDDPSHKCCGGGNKQSNHGCCSSKSHDHDHSHEIHMSEDADTCWHCGKSKKDKDLFCSEPTCGRVQSIQPQKLNLFKVFDIPQSYFVDEKQLDNMYKELQKKLHPDKFANKSIDEKNVSTSSSSAINFAYQTLKDPVERAQYLVWLTFEKQVFEERRTLEDPEFMMEIFELREEIQENRKNTEYKAKLVKYIQQGVGAAEQAFDQAIQSKASDQAMHQAMKLKYYHKMLEELHEHD